MTILPLLAASFAASALAAEFQGAGGAFTMSVPSGWRASETMLGSTPINVLQPSDGGEERALVGVGQASATTIQELARQTVQLVTQQLMPGLMLSGQPRYPQPGVVELSYTGGGGQAVWWQAVMLKGDRYATVLGGSRSEKAPAMEVIYRGVFKSMELRALPAAAQGTRAPSNASQMLVGHWTWYHQTSNGGTRIAAGTSKELWMYPNGRFQYSASTYTPNLPVDVDPTTNMSGTYQVQGNTIVATYDNGQRQTFRFEFVEGGKGLRIEGELFIRE